MNPESLQAFTIRTFFPINGTSNSLLAKTCTTNAWTHLAGLVVAGHTYTVTLNSHDDNYAGDPTYTLFDDVALTMVLGGTMAVGLISAEISPSPAALPRRRAVCTRRPCGWCLWW